MVKRVFGGVFITVLGMACVWLVSQMITFNSSGVEMIAWGATGLWVVDMILLGVILIMELVSGKMLVSSKIKMLAWSLALILIVIIIGSVVVDHH